jgi:hypothetical protein
MDQPKDAQEPQAKEHTHQNDQDCVNGRIDFAAQ